MTYIFNDLSLNSHIDTDAKFRDKIKEILIFAKTCRKYKNDFYLHQNGIYNSTICNTDFRTCVNKCCEREIKSQVLNLIDKKTPSLPAESAIPDGLCFYYNDAKIPSTGLAECAYQNFMDEDEICQSFSLSDGGFDMELLTIAIRDTGSDNEQIISNIYSLEKLEKLCENSLGCISSWEDMIERAQSLNMIRIEEYVIESLRKEPFSQPLAAAVLRRLRDLSNMISAKNDVDFDRLHRDNCMKANAHFSDESDTKICKYKDELTFKVCGENQVCSYHAKIKGGRQFRIHMNGRPSRGNERTIVYIGYKITKD